MLIPSIDLMGGKIVQLVQGENKALEFSDFEAWINRFADFPLIQLIDLDAAMETGSNRDLVRLFAQRLPCQVGGGIRSVEAARSALDAGAKRVIIGSRLIRNASIDVDFAKDLAQEFGPDRLVFAVDSKHGCVAIRGWREVTNITPIDMIQALDESCSAFLYTHIDTEGLMQGIPIEPVRALRNATTKQLIVAGGIASFGQIEQLDAMNVDAVVGMAIYTDKLDVKSPRAS